MARLKERTGAFTYQRIGYLDICRSRSSQGQHGCKEGPGCLEPCFARGHSQTAMNRTVSSNQRPPLFCSRNAGHDKRLLTKAPKDAESSRNFRARESLSRTAHGDHVSEPHLFHTTSRTSKAKPCTRVQRPFHRTFTHHRPQI